MAAHFNRPGFEMFDYDVYALAGDGCMMEGVSERGRVAGRPPASSRNLCWIYDNNHITIEGDTTLAFSEDVAHALHRLRLERHARRATRTTSRCSTAPSRPSRRPRGRPTLIIVDSHIGYGAPTKQDTPRRARRAARATKRSRLTKRFYGWPENEKFLVPDGVREHFARGHRARGAQAARRVDGAVRGLQGEVSARRPTTLFRMQHRQLPDGWDK